MTNPISGRSPVSPNSPSLIAESSGITQKITAIWTRAKSSLESIFSRTSDAAIDSALRPPLPSRPSHSDSPPSVEDSNSIDESEEIASSEDSSASAADEPIDSPLIHHNRAQVGDVLMEFTFKIDGKEIKLNSALTHQLIPLFTKLAETDTSLKSGFIFTINLKDTQDVHIYHDGAEILKKECAALLKNPAFRDSFDDFIGQIRAYQKHGWNISPTETNTFFGSRLPDYIEDVPGDGDCLLYAALKHIHGRDFSGDEAKQAASDLRRNIADQAALEQDETRQFAIIEDIRAARVHALEYGQSDELPYTYLFTDEMNQIFQPNVVVWDDSIGEAYRDYLLVETPKAYLGSFAINYLNEQYRDNPFFIVVPNEEGSFIPRDAQGEDLRPIGERRVLLLSGNHYQYIDATDSDFQTAFNRRTEEPES